MLNTGLLLPMMEVRLNVTAPLIIAESSSSALARAMRLPTVMPSSMLTSSDGERVIAGALSLISTMEIVTSTLLV